MSIGGVMVAAQAPNHHQPDGQQQRHHRQQHLLHLCPLAAQHLGAPEQVADVERQRLPDRALAHIIVAGDYYVFDCGLVFRIEREGNRRHPRGAVDGDRGVHFSVGVAQFEQARLQEDPRRVQPDQIERRIGAKHDTTVDLALGEERRGLVDCQA